ncbi:MAG: low molecular weight phosphotyrosine protein phosphatase [Bacteroidales bacterium]|nr:low molecular weight phosphotyrosine protein phosphatase [Bacteroidales bacterium]
MKKTKILFVCLGNICRSPSAEAVFKKIIKDKGVEELFEVDSAGTYAYHAGEPADARMRKHAEKRAYQLTSISRPFHPPVDFDKFDMIVAMDKDNLRELRQMARHAEDEKKLCMMTDFSRAFSYDHIPDPYYGGDAGFELVLDLLEDAGEGLYRSLKN